jgi:hypothetical protein
VSDKQVMGDEICRRLPAHLLAKFEARSGATSSASASIDNVLTPATTAPVQARAVALRA